MTSNQSHPERFGRRWNRRVRLGAIGLLVLMAVGVIGLHLFFVNLDEHIRSHIERVIAEANPHLVVRVQRARRLNAGLIEVRNFSIGNPDEEAPFLVIDEGQIACDTDFRKMIQNRVEITSIRLNRPHVRARIAKDGSCDLTKLLTMPMSTKRSAPVQIHDGTVDLLIATDGPVRRIQLRDVYLRVANYAPTKTRNAGVQVAGSYSGDHVQHVTFDYRQDAKTGAWSAQGKATELGFSKKLLANLPPFAATRLAPLSDLQAVSTFDYWIGDPADGREKQYRLNGNLQDGRITDPSFPYAFTDLQAEYSCTNQGVSFRNVRAMSGQAELTLAYEGGSVMAGQPFRLTATARNLPLDARLADALPSQMREVWDQFHPSGEVAASLVLDFDGKTWTPQLDLEFLHLNYVYDYFPFAVNGARGTMKLVGDTLTTDLRFDVSGQTVDVDSRLVFSDEPTPAGWITIKTQAPVVLSEQMIKALEPCHQEFARSLNFSGLIDCDARFEREHGEAGVNFRQLIKVHVSRGSLQYAQFPYPVSGIRGRVDFHDNGWVIRHLEGYNDAAFITASGSYAYLPERGDGEDLHLAIEGVDVPLDNTLRTALPAQAREVWTTMTPRGTLDHLAIRVDKVPEADQPSYHVKARKADAQDPRGAISVLPNWLPYRWDQVSGVVDFRDGVMTIENVSGRHGLAQLTLDGNGRFDENGWGVSLSRLSLENAQIDGDLITAMRPERLRQALLRSHVQGPLRVEGTVSFAGPRLGPVTANWNIYVDLENGSLNLGVPVRAIRGGMRLRGAFDGRSFRSSGALAVDSMMLNSIHLTRVHGPLWIDDNRVLFGADAFSVRPELPRQSVIGLAYQGVVTLDGEVGLNDANPFRVKASIKQGNLAHIVRHWSATPDKLTGKVFANLDLRGNGRGKHTWEGQGEFRLTEADIYRLPVMVGLLKLISVQQPDDTAFTHGIASFDLQGEHIYFKQIDLSGDVITLRGTGEMDLQRNVNLQFYTAIGRDQFYIPVIRPLLGDASRSFLLIEVGGSLDRPQIERKAFPEISQRLRRLLPPDVLPANGPAVRIPDLRDYIPRIVAP